MFTESIQRQLGYLLTDKEGLISPCMVPVAVASTIVNPYVVQKRMNRSDRFCAIPVKYDVGISIDSSFFKHDGIGVTYEAATTEILYDRFD